MIPESDTDRRLPPPLPPWAQVTAARRAHILRVDRLLGTWAEAMEVPPAEAARWRRAALLHDALKDAPDDVVAAWARPRLGPPGLWHGPAAAARAEAEGERDAGVLAAVRYHSIGWADWDDVGRMLYLADFLEPGRRFEAEIRARWVARVPQDPMRVLREVAAARRDYARSRGWTPLPETEAFWIALG